MTFVDHPDSSAYRSVNALVDEVVSRARARERMDEHLKLVEIIESGRHLLVGAKALATYMKQRFTEDTDYIVAHRTFLNVRRWLKQAGVAYEDHGGLVRSESLGIDVIDAGPNPVFKEILRRETGVPSQEALAATKYVAMVSGTREMRKFYQDVSDFVGLVNLEGFDVDRFLGFLVERYEEQRSHARELIDRIRRGESPLTI